jgi:predicted aldo/keto reductase-like oxidoreductase
MLETLFNALMQSNNVTKMKLAYNFSRASWFCFSKKKEQRKKETGFAQCKGALTSLLP